MTQGKTEIWQRLPEPYDRYDLSSKGRLRFTSRSDKWYKGMLKHPKKVEGTEITYSIMTIVGDEIQEKGLVIDTGG